ncbi:hypothetical protein E2C01_071716 [Portunus trituberculatus]|uniref:Uncharacterized protein n=1 Tax=Portunus trituberculatus TaxID=210409 RepID=A0A5B7I550_PORTR|nr:hypothetical protein [Portunus trituberculatus]
MSSPLSSLPLCLPVYQTSENPCFCLVSLVSSCAARPSPSLPCSVSPSSLFFPLSLPLLRSVTFRTRLPFPRYPSSFTSSPSPRPIRLTSLPIHSSPTRVKPIQHTVHKPPPPYRLQFTNQHANTHCSNRTHYSARNTHICNTSHFTTHSTVIVSLNGNIIKL